MVKHRRQRVENVLRKSFTHGKEFTAHDVWMEYHKQHCEAHSIPVLSVGMILRSTPFLKNLGRIDGVNRYVMTEG